MKQLINYETVSEAVKDLYKRGYTTDFLLLAKQGRMYRRHSMTSLLPEEFAIDETYRFEGMTDPGDEMIVFAISSIQNQTKGIIVNGYGTYADEVATKIVQRLKRRI
jgi:hypothetical protein